MSKWPAPLRGAVFGAAISALLFVWNGLLGRLTDLPFGVLQFLLFIMTAGAMIGCTVTLLAPLRRRGFFLAILTWTIGAEAALFALYLAIERELPASGMEAGTLVVFGVMAGVGLAANEWYLRR